MPYFGTWFGPDPGADYFEDWFDADGDAAEAPPAPSAEGGVSKPRLLSNLAPRPVVPPWRQINGPTGVTLTEVRRFLHDTQQKDHLWGNHVEVEFAAASTATPVATGLGGSAKGYKVVKSNAGITVFDATPPADAERGVLWLQSSGAGKVTLYVY
jgi:hypothetical protein